MLKQIQHRPASSAKVVTPAKPAVHLAGLKLSISSPNDLFFAQSHACDRDHFAALKSKQKLRVDWDEYPTVLLSSLLQCQKKKQVAAFVPCPAVDGQSSGGRLEFIEMMAGAKFVTVFACDCADLTQQEHRAIVNRKYQQLRKDVQATEKWLQEDVYYRLKVTAPSIFADAERLRTNADAVVESYNRAQAPFDFDEATKRPAGKAVGEVIRASRLTPHRRKT